MPTAQRNFRRPELLLPPGAVQKLGQFLLARDRERRARNRWHERSFLLAHLLAAGVLILSSFHRDPMLGWTFNPFSFLLKLGMVGLPLVGFALIARRVSREGDRDWVNYDPVDQAFRWMAALPDWWRRVFYPDTTPKAQTLRHGSLASDLCSVHYPAPAHLMAPALGGERSLQFCLANGVLVSQPLDRGPAPIAPGRHWLAFNESQAAQPPSEWGGTPRLAWAETHRLHLPIVDFTLDAAADRWAAVDEGGRLNLGRSGEEAVPLRLDKPLRRARFDTTGRLWALSDAGQLWIETEPGQGRFLDTGDRYATFHPLGQDGFVGVDPLKRLRYESLDRSFRVLPCYHNPDLLAADPYTGQLLAVDTRGHFTLFNGFERRLERPLGRPISHAALGRWGHRLYFFAPGEGVLVFDTPARALYEIGFTEGLKAFGADPWGRYLLLLSESNHLVLVGPEGKLLEDARIEGGADFLRVDPTGRRVWVVGRDGALHAFDLFESARADKRPAFHIEIGMESDVPVPARAQPEGGRALPPVFHRRLAEWPVEHGSPTDFRACVAPGAEYSLLTDGGSTMVWIDADGRDRAHRTVPGGFYPPTRIGAAGFVVEDDLSTGFYDPKGVSRWRWDGNALAVRYGTGPIAVAIALYPDRLVLLDGESRARYDGRFNVEFIDMEIAADGTGIAVLTPSGEVMEYDAALKRRWGLKIRMDEAADLLHQPSSADRARPRLLRAASDGWWVHNHRALGRITRDGAVAWRFTSPEGIADFQPLPEEVVVMAPGNGFERVLRLAYNGEPLEMASFPERALGIVGQPGGGPLALAAFSNGVYAIDAQGVTQWRALLDEPVRRVETSEPLDALILLGASRVAAFRLPGALPRAGSAGYLEIG